MRWLIFILEIIIPPLARYLVKRQEKKEREDEGK